MHNFIFEKNLDICITDLAIKGTVVSAISVGELGEILKEITNGLECKLNMPLWNFYRKKWSWCNGWGDTEANARGLLAIYARENGLI